MDTRLKLLNCGFVIENNFEVNPKKFTKYISSIGPIANWGQFVFDYYGNRLPIPTIFPNPDDWEDDFTYPVQRVTGKKINNEFSGIFSTGILDWHSNLNGPTRADGVALLGAEEVDGTQTQILDTISALKEIPSDLYNRVKDKVCEYEYEPSNWAKGLPEIQLKYMKTDPSKYTMSIIQKNIIGTRGIYFYPHNNCILEKKLFDDLYDFLFQEKYITTLNWQIGDVLIMDQLTTLHKRVQNDPHITCPNRVLWRITFKLSNIDNWINQQAGNKILP